MAPRSRPDPTGTLISVAPAACEPGHLLRPAIDAEQVGATRIHLAVDQPDFVAAVAGLRGQTDLVITADPDHDGSDLVDRVPTHFTEVVLDGDDPTTLTAEVARIADTDPSWMRRRASLSPPEARPAPSDGRCRRRRAPDH